MEFFLDGHMEAMSEIGGIARRHRYDTRMDLCLARFVERAESDGEDPLKVAYGLFRLLKISTKEMLFSAVREANGMGVSRLRYVESLLAPRKEREHEVYPQNVKLLDITYEKRELAEYDELA